VRASADNTDWPAASGRVAFTCRRDMRAPRRAVNLLLECNTRRQPVVESRERLKRQQMLDILASRVTPPVSDCRPSSRPDRRSGASAAGWFLGWGPS
jgi:hypothetical protein